MANPKQDPDQWTEADAVALRTFLSANPKFLSRLTNMLPEIKGDTMEARAVTGSDANGYIICLKNIANLKRSQATNEPPAGFIEEK